jgi:hypothetical protein
MGDKKQETGNKTFEGIKNNFKRNQVRLDS